MGWMIKEDQLDPDQRDFINIESRKTGNIWVQGFAGSGKSVLLIHSLMTRVKNDPSAKVIVLVFTLALKEMFERGISDLRESYGLKIQIPVKTYYDFVDKDNEHYDYILCDEVQDLPAKVLYAMKNRSNQIIVAGDSNQSIYDTDPKWREQVVDPELVGEILNARAFALGTIHRLTKSIIAAVQKLLPTMNIWGAKRDLTKVDFEIRLCEASKLEEEASYIYKEASKGANVLESSVVLLPTIKLIVQFANEVLAINGKTKWLEKKNRFNSPDFGDLNSYLRKNGVKMQFFGSGYGSLVDSQNNREIILMTYHSSKGLDFDNVFLPYLNNNFYLHPSNAKTLFMVAMTRSRKSLYLTYFGYTYDLVDKFKDDCKKISIADILNPPEKKSGSPRTFDY